MIPSPTFAPWSRNRFASGATNRWCDLEVCAGADPAITEMLRARFELNPVDIYEMQAELDYTTSV